MLNVPGQLFRWCCEKFGARNRALIIGYLTMISALINLGWSTFAVIWAHLKISCTHCDTEKLKFMDNLDDTMNDIMRYTSLGVHGFQIGNDFMRISDYDYFQNNNESYYSFVHVCIMDIFKVYISYIWFIASVDYIYSVHTKRVRPMIRMTRLALLKIFIQIGSILIPMYIVPDEWVTPVFGIFHRDHTMEWKVVQYIDVCLSFVVVWAMFNYLIYVQLTRPTRTCAFKTKKYNGIPAEVLANAEKTLRELFKSEIHASYAINPGPIEV